MTDTRVCKGCKVEKAISEFRAIRNNHLHKCRDCGLEYNRKYMRAYRAKRTEDRRSERLAETAAKPNGRPSYNQRLEFVESLAGEVRALKAEIAEMKAHMELRLQLVETALKNSTET